MYIELELEHEQTYIKAYMHCRCMLRNWM